MFSLLKKKKTYRPEALRLYAEAMAVSRSPVFYRHWAVPDTMDGRFDLLLLYLFLILNRLFDDSPSGVRDQDELAQALFDVAFEDVDQALRESGIGDMGIRKHMKRMMLAFNGRMHAYDDALAQGDVSFKAALRRNVYGTVPDVPEMAVDSLLRSLYAEIDHLKAQPVNQIRSGHLCFRKPEFVPEDDQERAKN